MRSSRQFKNVALIGFLSYGLSGSSFSYTYLEDPNMPLSGTVLVDLCSTSDPHKRAYCEGYVDGAMQLWKRSTACQSALGSDQSFCRGVAAAESRVQEVLEACQDCNPAEFRPDLDDPAERGRSFIEHMQDFVAEARETLEKCSPHAPFDEHYCNGFDAQVENSLASLAVMYQGDEAAEPGLHGRGQAQNDLVMHLWASKEIYRFQPCVRPATTPGDARNSLLEFVRERPDQLGDTTATIVFAKALYYRVCPGPKTGAQPHMEHCTTWDYDDGQFGTRNTCGAPVYVQFLAPGQRSIERRLDPDESLQSGLNRAQIDGLSWMFTTCPAGYMSSLPLGPQNRTQIAASHYDCIER